MRIGLLTGTFDPIHLGHVELAQAAKSECALDEVWILVNDKRDNAAVESKAGVLDFSHRLEMSKIATRNSDGIDVYDGAFAHRPHTMSTFVELMARYPRDSFIFIVGMDTIERLDGWNDVESVVKNSSFAVAARAGSTSLNIEELKARLGPLGDELDAHLFEFDDHGATTSTKIREQVRRGEYPDSIDENVYGYILKHDLYV